jgi:hypothetical protein
MSGRAPLAISVERCPKRLHQGIDVGLRVVRLDGDARKLPLVPGRNGDLDAEFVVQPSL